MGVTGLHKNQGELFKIIEVSDRLFQSFQRHAQYELPVFSQQDNASICLLSVST